MVDVCRVEDNDFVYGIKMGEYWNSTFDKDNSFATPGGSLRGEYLNVRSIVQGNLFGLVLGFCSYEEFQPFVDYDYEEITLCKYYWLITFSADCMAVPNSWQRCIKNIVKKTGAVQLM